jgi:hypothetical protein
MKSVMMRLLAIAFTGVGLGFGALAIGQTFFTSLEADKRAAAQNAILRLGEHLGDKDVADQAKKIVQQHASEDISSVFKLKAKGGLGIGKLIEVSTSPDGIERFLIRLQNRKTITEAEIEKYSADYLRVARVMQAMAELAPFRAQEHVQKSERLSKEWRDVAFEFKEGAANFRRAVEEKDPKKLRLAARRMETTCCNCHNLVQ